jgi:hypothetical protein
VGEGRVELVRPVDPTPVDDHHHLFVGFAKNSHYVMNILAQFLGVKMRHNFGEDLGGALLDSAKDAEHHTAGTAAPGAIL